jgi:Fe-S-cluster containining protein
MMFYREQSIHFECSGCGRCCFGHPDEHYIELAPGEARNIRQFLGMDKKPFKRDYLVQLPGIGEGLRINSQGRCVLLDENSRCSVYKVRPRQCMTYPFWPELMHSAEAWHAEAARCEGINQGEVVPLTMIEKQLKCSDSKTR